jgi:hypothetical protein
MSQTTPPVADISATLDRNGPAPEVFVYDGGPNNYVIYSLDLYAPPDFDRIAELADHVNSSQLANQSYPVAGQGVPPVAQLPGTKLLYSAVLNSPVPGNWKTMVEVKQANISLGTATLTAAVASVPTWVTGVIRITFQ